jgi:hyperosmotically inducible periplasmic protein
MRTLLIATLLILAVFVIWAYPGRPKLWESRAPASGVGTSGTVDKARERGAELGEKAAVAGEKIKDAAHDAAITSKIKAKMALDDSVKARAIDVSTDGSMVTVSGTVRSRAEHDRALALARETAGVTTVIDHLTLVGQHP